MHREAILAAFAISLMGLAPECRATDLARPLSTILHLGREAAGNREAMSAWGELAQAEGADVFQMLAALNEASPLSANWIRSAIETVAAREHGTGHIVGRTLKAFVLDTGNAPRARRLAYEILAREFPTQAAEMVPGFLNDPSVELRRDAVALRIKEAKAAHEAQHNDEAHRLYDEALTGARDIDQVEAIAAELKKLGSEPNLADHFGFVLEWRLIGPFDNTSMSAFDTAYPPESELNFNARYEGKDQQVSWKECTTADRLGMVDLNKELGKFKGSLAYAATEFRSREGGPVEIRIGSPNAVKVWVNGREAGGFNFYHAGEFVDQYTLRAELRPGANSILLKILQNEQTEDWAQVWQFQCRVCDAAGTAVLSTDRLAGGPAAPTAGSGGR